MRAIDCTPCIQPHPIMSCYFRVRFVILGTRLNNEPVLEGHEGQFLHYQPSCSQNKLTYARSTISIMTRLAYSICTYILYTYFIYFFLCFRCLLLKTIDVNANVLDDLCSQMPSAKFAASPLWTPKHIGSMPGYKGFSRQFSITHSPRIPLHTYMNIFTTHYLNVSRTYYVDLKSRKLFPCPISKTNDFF